MTDTKKSKGGRPTKLTPEVQQIIVDAVQMGNFVEVACALAGIHKDTFYEWLARAEKAPRSIYGKFRDAVNKAMAEAENDAVMLITAAGTTQWQALAWRLERAHPERWGQRMKVDSKNEHTGKDGGPIQTRHVVEVEFVDADDGGSAGDSTDPGAVPS